MADRDTRRTQPSDADVEAYLDSVEQPRRREEALAALSLMREVSGAEPRMWGASIVGSNRDLLERLGPHTTGKGCLYVKRFEELDHEVLRELVTRSWESNHSG